MFWKVELFHRALEKESIESRMVDTKVQAHPTDDIKNPLFEGDLNLRDGECYCNVIGAVFLNW